MYVKPKLKDPQTASVLIKGVNKDKFFEALDVVKSIDGRKYNDKTKAWTIPITAINLKTLKDYGFTIDEELDKSLKAIIKRRTRKVNIDPIKDMPLYPFQFEGVKYIERWDGRALLSDSMGMGKTIQAVAYLKLHPELRPAVVVCPASLKLNWKKEIKKWIGEESFCIFGRKEIQPILNWPIYIINYELLGDHFKFIKEKAKIIIGDEIHYIKNPKAARTKHFKKLSKKVEKIIAISGTPITSRPSEFFTILNILDPNSWNNNWRFLERYCGLAHNGFGWEAKGATNTEELHKKLTETVMIRRTKEEVLKDLPQKTRSVVYIPMDEQTKYNSKRDQLTADIISGKVHNATSILAEIEALKQLAVHLKMKYIIEWIENFIESGEKLVVFATHHFVVDKLKEKFSGLCVTLDGRTPQLKRQEVVEDFQHNPDIKLFIGNIKAAGVGITLTAASNTAFIEFGWTPGEHDQAEDRCILEGQLIHTSKGFIPIENVKIGDFVLNSKNQMDEVIDIIKRKNNKSNIILECYNWFSPIEVTCNHEILLENKGWVQAGDIQLGDVIACPTNKIKNAFIEKIKFPDKYRIDNTFKNQFGIIQKNGRLKKAPEYLILNETLCFIFGYYLGDGFSSIGNNKGSAVSFSGNKTKKKKYIKTIKKYFESLNFNCNLSNPASSQGIEIRIFSKEFANFFAGEFGRTCKLKHIPEWIFNLSQKQCNWILKGLIASDGYVRNGRCEYVTSSNLLCSSYIRLLNYLNYPCGIKKNKSDGCWIISHNFNKTKSKKLKITKITKKFPDKNKFIYDLTVKNDHTFCIGNAVVHNCHRIGQESDSVTAWYLVAEGTIEEEIVELIDEKRKDLDAILDGKVTESSSLISELIKRIKGES